MGSYCETPQRVGEICFKTDFPLIRRWDETWKLIGNEEKCRGALTRRNIISSHDYSSYDIGVRSRESSSWNSIWDLIKLRWEPWIDVRQPLDSQLRRTVKISQVVVNSRMEILCSFAFIYKKKNSFYTFARSRRRHESGAINSPTQFRALQSLFCFHWVWLLSRSREHKLQKSERNFHVGVFLVWMKNISL